jgi:alkylation response protein AidB-like acyl-CoA dehydrogenase
LDFTLPYTEEQELFRNEVRSWLEANIPEEMKNPVDSRDLDDDEFERHYYFWREKQLELADKGWLAPTMPNQYGGGGLTGDHETILQEEFSRHRSSLNAPGGFLTPALLVWATEEQKKMFLVPILKGEKVASQGFSEPQSGSDLASIQSTAVRDGDDWVINGSKVFQGNPPDNSWVYGPIMTDSDAPRHRNLGFFMIPARAPGVMFTRTRTFNGNRQNLLFFENVRVPGNHLIGGDHQGWQVANTSLEQEHGGRGQAFPKDEHVDNLISYLQGAKETGGLTGTNPVFNQQAMAAYLDAHLHNLFSRRNYWMYQARQEMSYHGSQATMWHKIYGMVNADRARDIMKVYALMGTRESRALYGGRPEAEQRRSLTWAHPGGTIEIQKVIVARRIGISRTQERAAPTPSTATKAGA